MIVCRKWNKWFFMSSLGYDDSINTFEMIRFCLWRAWWTGSLLETCSAVATIHTSIWFSGVVRWWWWSNRAWWRWPWTCKIKNIFKFKTVNAELFGDTCLGIVYAYCGDNDVEYNVPLSQNQQNYWQYLKDQYLANVHFDDAVIAYLHVDLECLDDFFYHFLESLLRYLVS